jgi:hypothetical protein
MSQLLLQVVIVVALGAFCFGGGYLTGFIVTRNRWLDEMIKRGVARSAKGSSYVNAGGRQGVQCIVSQIRETQVLVPPIDGVPISDNTCAIPRSTCCFA